MNSLLSFCFACLPCFPDLSTPSIKINNCTYKISKLLGEGAYSYVYLVHQASSQSVYALKKINCPFGVRDETYKNAIREVRNYHRFTKFRTPYIIQSIDESIVSHPDGSKYVYVLLPYFHRSLQDMINEHVFNNTKFEESEILKIFIGICRGLEVMHNYKHTSNSSASGRLFSEGNDEDEALLARNETAEDDENDENDNLHLPHPATDAGTEAETNNSTEMAETIPFAHHDLKPPNVMLSAEGLSVLVDLGSCSRARIRVRTRQQALTVTDFAQEHCTLPYRAPELMDVETGAYITEATDIWSLGCLLYCTCFGYSPFEKLEIDQGANLNLAISQGKYHIPEDRNGYSKELIDLIRQCLQVKAKNRPTARDLIQRALEISRKLDV